MDVRSFLSDALIVAGVWTFTAFFVGGIAGAITLAFGAPDADIGRATARGAAAGFIIGIPLAIAVALLLAVSS